MKIFLTGTNGFIGRNLLEYYIDHELFEYDRSANIKDQLFKIRPDLIIHCAAEIYDYQLMRKSNIDLLYDILEYTKDFPNTQMIFIGSSSEYGPTPKAASETDRLNPIDLYQATKGAGTLLCQGFARQFLLDITIIRAYSVYGKYEKSHRLFPRLWRSFFLNEPMNLFHGFHDFIYIDDFIRGIDNIIKKDNKPVGDIVNLGSGIQYSNAEVFELFKKITKKVAPVTFISTMAKEFETELWCCDTTYAKEQYGFETNFTLEDGINNYIKKMEI